MERKVVAVGDVSLRVELDLREEEPRARFGIEGAAADVACTAIHLGEPARLIGTVGRDRLAERLKEALARVEGLETHLLEFPERGYTGWRVQLWPDGVEERKLPPGLDLSELNPKWLEGARLVHLAGHLTSRAEPGPVQSLLKQARGQAPSACQASTEEGCLAWFKERRERQNRQICEDIRALRDQTHEIKAAFSLDMEALPWGLMELGAMDVDEEARKHEIEEQLKVLEGVDFLLAEPGELSHLAYALDGREGAKRAIEAPARWLFERARPKWVALEGGVGDRTLEVYEGGDRVLTLELPRRPWRVHQRLLRSVYTALVLAWLQGLPPKEAQEWAERALDLELEPEPASA